MKIGIVNLHTIIKSQNELFKNIFVQTCAYTDAIPISFFKSNKLDKIAKRECLKVDVKKKNWDEVKEEMDLFLEKEKFDKMFIVGLPSFDTLNYNRYDSFKKILEKIKEDNTYAFNYTTTREILIPQLIFIEKCIEKNIDIINLVYDPSFVSLRKVYPNYKIKEVYSLNKPEKDLKFFPYYERAMFLDNDKLKSNLKLNDLLFYCTVITEDRNWVLNYKDTLERLGCKLITDTLKESCSQTEYFEKLSYSKYTIVIPSFDKTTFSIYRMLEALSVNCLPFIYKDCDLTDLKNTFPKLFRFIFDFDLILNDFSELEEKMKLFDEVREDIIEYFNENKNELLENILDNDTLKRYYKEILEND